MPHYDSRVASTRDTECHIIYLGRLFKWREHLRLIGITFEVEDKQKNLSMLGYIKSPCKTCVNSTMPHSRHLVVAPACLS